MGYSTQKLSKCLDVHVNEKIKYFVTSIIWQYVYKDMANFLSKQNILLIKIKQRDLVSDSKIVSDLIAYLKLLRITECSVHDRGSTAPSVLVG